MYIIVIALLCLGRSYCVGIAVHSYDPGDDPTYIKPQICSTIHSTTVPQQTKPSWWSNPTNKNDFYKKKNGSNLTCA